VLFLCFGPTTPTRAGRFSDASVDPTEARKGNPVKQGNPRDEGRADHHFTPNMGYFVAAARTLADMSELPASLPPPSRQVEIRRRGR
jgi:hypothetical protein